MSNPEHAANELPDPAEAQRFRGIARIIVFIACCWSAAAFLPRLGGAVWMPIEEIRDPVTFALGLLGALLALTGGVARATAILPIRWTAVAGLLIVPVLTVGGSLLSPRSYAVTSQSGRYDLVVVHGSDASRAEVWTCGALRWCRPCKTVDLGDDTANEVSLGSDKDGAWLVIGNGERQPVGACSP